MDLWPLPSPPPPLLSGPSSSSYHLSIILEFIASKTYHSIEFTRNGNPVIVFTFTEDGNVIPMFQVWPPPLASRGVGNSGGERAVAVLWHVYNLQRGRRTFAVVEGVSDDGVWIAAVMIKWTVDIFTVNLYGGKPDN